MIAKQGTTSKVTSVIMHILHDSHLFGSSLWPRNGFIAGYGGDSTKNDIVTIGIIISYNKEYNINNNSITLNVINETSKRSIPQSKILDMILDEAIHNNLIIKSWVHTELEHSFRYKPIYHHPNGMPYCQLKYSFTIND